MAISNAKGKRDWTAPELTVLVRSKPEEAVLFVCKLDSAPVGPDRFNNQCNWELLGPPAGMCGQCNTIAKS